MQTSELKTQFFRRQAIPPKVVTEAATPARGHLVADAPTQLWFPAATAQPAAVPQPARQKRPFLKYLFLGMVLLTLLATGFTAVAGASLIYLSDLVLPGVQVMDVELGRLTQAEAADALQAAASQQTVRLTHEDTIWMMSLAELGLTLDAATTAEAAHAYGRTLAAWLEFAQTGQMSVPPSWILDTAVAKTALHARAAELAVEPVNAGLIIEDDQVKTTLAADGQMLDVDATVATLASSTAALQNGEINLMMQPVAPAITDVSGAVAQAQSLLATTIAISATDPVQDEAVTWVVGPQVWGNWLTLAVDPDNSTQFDWAIEPDKATQFFAERNAALGENRYLDEEIALTAVTEAIKNQQESINLRIYHSPSQYIAQPGDTFAGIGRKVGIPYPWIQAANPGVGDALSMGQSITIPSPDDLLPYPVVEGKRVVVSISQQRTWVYENGALKWEWPASTGIASSPTAPGVFQVQTHEPNAYAGNWDLWMPNFMGIYQPSPNVEFMNGFHGFPTRDGANLLWTNNLGTPVTYGCILLSNENAAQLYKWAEQGVIVEILP